MGITASTAKLGTELPPLVKHMTQEKMNYFSGNSGRPSQHTDPAVALKNAGMPAPFASGRMSLAYAAEALGRFVGTDVYQHTGSVDLRFKKPVMHGDTITVKGHVTELRLEGNAVRVVFAVWCENQKGDQTAVGGGSALLPK